jgi:branched-chain amino acid transport system ATP-binding protein
LATSALSLTGVDAYYGDSHVLQQVSFALGEGRLLGLLGRNGAGKTTCMNVSVGLLPPRQGSVEVFGTPVTRLPPELIAARGVALVPQGRRVFKSLTVRENLMVAARTEHAGRRHAPWTMQTVFAMFPRLAERHSPLAGHLSGGEQQMLAIGRILRTGARFLMLDEPTEGLAPVIIQQIGQTIKRLKSEGFTILLVEQNFRFAATVADRYYIVEHGKIIDGFANAELQANMDKLHTYLGV